MPEKRERADGRISRFFINLRIRHKFQLVFTLVILVIFFVMFSVSQLSLNAYTDILYEQSAQLLSVSTVTVESAAKTVDMMTYRLLGDADFQALLLEVEASKGEEAWEGSTQRLMTKIWNFMYGEEFILFLQAYQQPY